MKATAIFCFLLGLVTLFAHFYEQDQSIKEAKFVILAKNFITYRSAVSDFIHDNPTTTLTEITTEQITTYLPVNWQAMRTWKTAIQNNIAYLYGAATAEEAVAVRRYAYGSPSLGLSVNGNFISGTTTMALPAIIPDGQLISVMSVGD
ncbi:MAG: type IV pilus biogenesis protein PilM [Pseudomonadota bacterium]